MAAGSQAATFVCDPAGLFPGLSAAASGRAVASAEARGFARAVAEISVDCYLGTYTQTAVRNQPVRDRKGEGICICHKT